MQSNKELGRIIKYQMMNQILQYKQLVKKNMNKKVKSQNEKVVRTSNQNQLKDRINSRRPQSAQTYFSEKASSRKSCSAQRMLKIYKLKTQQQLKNPFHKIHVNRSNSQSVTTLKPEQSPYQQSDRYEKIKEYYEAKYVSKQQEQNYDINIVNNESLKLTRPQTAHRNYRFQRKNY